MTPTRQPTLCDVPGCTNQARALVEFKMTYADEVVRLLCRSHARTLLVASGYAA